MVPSTRDTVTLALGSSIVGIHAVTKLLSFTYASMCELLLILCAEPLAVITPIVNDNNLLLSIYFYTCVLYATRRTDRVDDRM